MKLTVWESRSGHVAAMLLNPDSIFLNYTCKVIGLIFHQLNHHLWWRFPPHIYIHSLPLKTQVHLQAGKLIWRALTAGAFHCQQQIEQTACQQLANSTKSSLPYDCKEENEENKKQSKTMFY